MSLTRYLSLGSIVALLFITQAFAKTNPRRAIVFGGGCEDETNRFVPVMSKQSQGLRKNGWKVSPIFAADSSKEDIKLIAQASGVMPKNVINASKKSLLNSLDEMIADPNFKNGSQLLISFNTHGMPKPDGSGHRLCLQKNLADDSKALEMNLDDPEILSRLKTLKKKKVKMGFTDMSCYSGASVDILREYGCVVASQSDNYTSSTYGVAGSLGALLNLPKESLNKKAIGKNGRLTLEDVYLDTVLHGADYKVKGFPPGMDRTMQPTSSIFLETKPLSSSVLEMFAPRSYDLPYLTEEQRCELRKTSVQQVTQFFYKIKDQIDHDLLMNLSGRKFSSLSGLAKDLRRRIEERQKIEKQYKRMSEEENSLVSKYYYMEFPVRLKVPDALKAVAEHLPHAMMESYSSQFRDISLNNGALGLSAFIDFFDEATHDREARRMHKFLSDRANNPIHNLSLKSIPSVADLELFMKNAVADAKKQAGEKLNGVIPLKLKSEQFKKEIKFLEKKHPFLKGEGYNDISRDFNLLTAGAYLHEREKWMSSKKLPEHFKNCAEFELN